MAMATAPRFAPDRNHVEAVRGQEFGTPFQDLLHGEVRTAQEFQ